MDNQSVAINKSQATTCSGSGSNEIGATNKYGPNDNKSGATCCCGSVSIEAGTIVVAIVLCVLYMVLVLLTFHLNNSYYTAYAIVYGVQARNPWLFVPYLILGVFDMIVRVLFILASLGCVFETPVYTEFEKFTRGYGVSGCFFFLVYFAVSFPLSVWFYSIIVRGFSALKEVERRRYRPTSEDRCD
uniref:G_PROTEIN_RECEP_F1_2 domain-containing protein n=1 Tax=Globodera pallida TaxID=36090 RepID=A0A183CCV0_GLOPA